MKKSNKMLVGILLIALMAYSWYTLISSGVEKKKTLDSYINEARYQKELGILDKASYYYNLALATNESLDIRLEFIDSFKDVKGYAKTYVSMCEEFIDLYPYETAGYERLMSYYIETKAFKDSFSIYASAKKRGIINDVLTQMYDSVKYEYYTEYDTFYDVSIFSGGMCAVETASGLFGFVNYYGDLAINYKYSKVTDFSTQGYAIAIDKDGLVQVITTSGTKQYVDPSKRNITDFKPYINTGFAACINGKYTFLSADFTDLFGSYDNAGAIYEGVVAVCEGSDWKVVNTAGEQVSTEVFEDIKLDEKGIAFRNGVGFGKKNGAYYLINNKGELLSQEAYGDADVFNSSGYAAVKKGDKWGFIDTVGNMVIEPQYDEANSFSTGLAAVCQQDEWFYIDTTGTKVISGGFAGAKDMSAAGTAFVKTGEYWKLLLLYSYGN